MKRIIIPLIALLSLIGSARSQTFPSITTPLINVTVQGGSPTSVSQVNVQVVGAAGTSTYYVWVVAKFAIGNAAPSPYAIVRGAPNLLSAQDYIRASWNPPVGSTGFDILLTTNDTVPSGTGNFLAGSSTAATYNIQSSTTSSYTVTTFSGDVTFNEKSVPVGSGEAQLTWAADQGPQFWIDNKKGIYSYHPAITPTSIEAVEYADQYLSGSNTAGIVEAEAALPSGGGEIYLPAGTYTTTETAKITKSNVHLVCAAGAVIDFEPTAPIDYNHDNDRAVSIDGTANVGPAGGIAAAISKGDTTFTSSVTPPSMSAGQWLMIRENDPAVGDYTYFDWVQVASVSGDVITVAAPFRMSFPDSAGHTLQWVMLTPLENDSITGCNIKSNQAVTGTPGISVSYALNPQVHNNTVSVALGQPLYMYEDNGGDWSGNYAVTGGSISSEFAESVNWTAEGNSFGMDGGTTPTTAAIDIDMGSAFFAFVGNTMRTSGNIGTEALYHPHDGVISDNSMSFTASATNAVGFASKGMQNVAVIGNTFPGGDGSSSQGISAGDCTICSPTIISTGNTFVGNLISGYTYPYGTAQDSGDTYQQNQGGGINILGNVQLGVATGAHFGDAAPSNPFDVYAGGALALSVRTDGSVRAENWLGVGSVGSTPPAPMYAYYDGSVTDGFALIDSHAGHGVTMYDAPGVGCGNDRFGAYDATTATCLYYFSYTGAAAWGGGGEIPSSSDVAQLYANVTFASVTSQGDITFGGVTIPNTAPSGSGLCLASTSTSAATWGACSGSSSTNWSALVAGTLNNGGNYFAQGTTTIAPAATSPGVIDANQLQGVNWSATAPTNGQCSVYNSTNSDWEPGTCGGGSLPVVLPETYGAKGDGAYYFDGAITPSTNITVGDSVAPATPAVATAAANAVVDYAWVTNTSWSAAPSVGTSRIAQTYPGAGFYVLTVRDQSVVAAGSVPSASGTTASSQFWNAGDLIVPASGGSAPAVVGTPTDAQINSGNTTVSVPTGAASGDVLVAFAGHYGTSLTWPAGWTLLQSVNDGNGDRLDTGYIVLSGAPPASYTWTGSGSIGIIAYSGAGTPYALSTLTSTTANFGTGIAGDAVCTAGTGTASVEQCGVIAGQISSTEAFVSYVAQLTPSNIWFGFGADDSAAFTTMLTSAPCSTVGCRAMLDSKGYVLTADYTFPPNHTIQFQGAGAGISNTTNSFINGNTPPNANTGTRLMFMTTALTKAAITIGGTANVTSVAAWDRLADLSLIAGAGKGRDGGGSDGVDILNWQEASLDRVIVSNFSGAGVYEDGITAATPKDYIDAIAYDGLYAIWNGGPGLQVGSATAVENIENTTVINGLFEGNGGAGIKLQGNVQGVIALDNLIQWNNQSGGTGKSEMEIDNNLPGGCVVEGNYFEDDVPEDSHFVTPGVSGCTIGTNYIGGPDSALAKFTGINTSSPTNTLTVGGGIASVPYALPNSLTPAMDVEASSVQQFNCATAGAAVTPTVTNLTPGTFFTVVFVQNATTACTWTWPAAVHGGGTVTTTLSGVSTQQFVVSNNGTDAYAVSAMQNMTGGTP